MKTTLASSPSTPVSQEEISLRAREIWLARGSPEGQDVEIWLLAERELGSPSSFSAKPAAKPGRKTRASTSQKNLAAAETIDVGELEDRLKSFGESPQRSPTSLDLG
jgi:Protein of unknown function (DUF2934)